MINNKHEYQITEGTQGRKERVNPGKKMQVKSKRAQI
jgi:hypothetical protein